jgi:hypothetical protein
LNFNFVLIPKKDCKRKVRGALNVSKHQSGIEAEWTLTVTSRKNPAFLAANLKKKNSKACA